jgi:Holliday junction resolvase-like predicted endonuclease
MQTLLSPRKKAALYRGATYFISKQNIDAKNMRFDLAVVSANNEVDYFTNVMN